LKPISFPRFLKATTKAIEYFRLLHRSSKDAQGADHFFVKSNGMLEKIVLNEIVAVEALANYVVLHTLDRKIIAYLPLRQVKDYLPPSGFLQVHKSYIIARDRVSKIDHDTIHAGKLQVPIGANFREEVNREIVGRILKR
jgi:DNA-binding LytR/AlgR family response regulator